MRSRNIIVSALVSVAVGLGAYAQQKTGRVKALTAVDHAEIYQLYGHYYWSADNGADNCLAWANLFTPDAVFYVGSKTAATGREELAAFCRTGTGPAPRHYGTNFHWDASPEGARGGAYNLLLSQYEPNKPRTIATTVAYEDILVKTRDGWRFKQRRSTANVLPSPSLP